MEANAMRRAVTDECARNRMEALVNTCRTCKHWDVFKSHDGDPHKHICERIKSHKDDAADTVNAEPYGGADIATGPNFGCIHYYPVVEPEHRCLDCGSRWTGFGNFRCPKCGDICRLDPD